MLSQTEPVRFVMPFPICPTCGTSIKLDEKTYQNFDGQVTCYECRSRMYVRITLGGLHHCAPLIDPDLEPPDGAGHQMPDGAWVGPRYWEAYIEALKSMMGGSAKGCAVMCRLALQWALMARGIPEGKTQTMINAAKSKGVLQGKYGHMADSVGFFGGKGGHPQDEEIFEVNEFEATHGLRVTQQLILYLLPVARTEVDPDELPFE